MAGINLSSVSYDIIGKNYDTYRIPDARISYLLKLELDDIDSVLNIGSGTGSYEPNVGFLVAVDPSSLMISRRKSESPALLAVAENLPFHDCSFDAATAILTIHHWNDIALGLIEALRVVRKRVVLLTWIGFPERFWLTDYFPEITDFDNKLFPPIDWFMENFCPVKIHKVPIPNNCTDGFLCAYWARPEQYLNSDVRSAISTFNRLGNSVLGLNRLRNDLKSGYWEKKYGPLHSETSKDLGYRIIVIDKSEYNNSLKKDTKSTPSTNLSCNIVRDDHPGTMFV